jgi:hypothetical protein
MYSRFFSTVTLAMLSASLLVAANPVPQQKNYNRRDFSYDVDYGGNGGTAASSTGAGTAFSSSDNGGEHKVAYSKDGQTYHGFEGGYNDGYNKNGHKYSGKGKWKGKKKHHGHYYHKSGYNGNPGFNGNGAVAGAAAGLGVPNGNPTPGGFNPFSWVFGKRDA